MMEHDNIACGDHVRVNDDREGVVEQMRAFPSGRHQSGPMRMHCWVRFYGGSGGWIPTSAITDAKRSSSQAKGES